MAHQRADIPPVEAHHAQVPVPPLCIQRVERPGDDRDLIVALDLQRPGVFILLGKEALVDGGHVQGRRIEDGVIAHQSLVRQLITVFRRLYHQDEEGRGGLDAPHGATGDHHIVAISQDEVSVVAVELSAPLVNEQELVAIGVAHQKRHGLMQAPDAVAAVGVAENIRHHPGGEGAHLLLQIVQVKRPWPKRPLPVDPVGGSMLVVHVGGRTEEARAPQLALIDGLLRQIGMGLAGVGSLPMGEAYPVTHRSVLRFSGPARHCSPPLAWIRPARHGGSDPAR